MPDFVPVAGSIEVRITGTHVGGKKMYNIFHVDCGSPLPSPSEVEAVADATALWAGASYRALFSDKITITEVRARSNAEEPGPVHTVVPVAAVGQLTGHMVPMNQTLLVNLLSGMTGHSRRGKFYLFAADENVQTDGLYTAGYVVGGQNVLNTLMGDLATAGFALAVESRRRLELYQVTAVLGQPIPSHLRSRKANRGI